MADYQYIQTRFWEDGFVVDLTPEEKYFYLYLLTNPLGNILGAFELPLRVIEMQTGYNRETVEKLLARFSEYGKVVYDKTTKELMLTNWLKHNGNRSPKLFPTYRRAFAAIKSAVIREQLVFMAEAVGVELQSNTAGKPLDKGMDTPSIPHESHTDTPSIPYPYPSDTTDTDTTQTQHNTSSVAIATAAEAAPGIPVSEQDRKKAMWDAAVDIFAKAGVPEKQARAIVGKHVKDYGNDVVEDVIASMVAAAPAEPIGYMTAALKDKRPSAGGVKGAPKQHELPKTYQKSGRL